MGLSSPSASFVAARRVTAACEDLARASPSRRKKPPRTPRPRSNRGARPPKARENLGSTARRVSTPYKKEAGRPEAVSQHKMMMSPPSPHRQPQSPRLGHPPPLATPGFFDDPDDDALIWTATSSHQLDQDKGWEEPPVSPVLRPLQTPSSHEVMEMAQRAWSPTKPPRPQQVNQVTPAPSPVGPVDHHAPLMPGLSTQAPEFVPGYPQQPQVPFDPHARMAGTIVHLSRRLCGAFTSRRLDGSTATYYNGWYGFVRPDAATLDAEGICRDDLFLHPSDAADDYNPAVGDRVTFRRGTHNGRAKAVEVRLIMDPARRMVPHEPAVAPCWAAPARAVSPDYRQAPVIRGENRHVSLGPRGSPQTYPQHAYAPQPQRAHFPPHQMELPQAAPPAHW